jgi:hypothetical protein
MDNRACLTHLVIEEKSEYVRKFIRNLLRMFKWMIVSIWVRIYLWKIILN